MNGDNAGKLNKCVKMTDCTLEPNGLKVTWYLDYTIYIVASYIWSKFHKRHYKHVVYQQTHRENVKRSRPRAVVQRLKSWLLNELERG